MKSSTPQTLIVTLFLMVLTALPAMAAEETVREKAEAPAEATDSPAAQGPSAPAQPVPRAENVDNTETHSGFGNREGFITFTSTSECNPGTCEGQCCLDYEACVAGGTSPLTCMKARVTCVAYCCV